ncbi:hypothetical protein IV203_038781 [Nitzschia inconspicua]|uniref:Uncharacterized protein n=1 Tax=Nitzschia inconspicua TaxID=303405 RepID=A0A9K3PZ91_9STRA|nr:hypothetical protein IV203_038781 [Nitzschia inconspicua]
MNRATRDPGMGVDRLPFLPTRRSSLPLPSAHHHDSSSTNVTHSSIEEPDGRIESAFFTRRRRNSPKRNNVLHRRQERRSSKSVPFPASYATVNPRLRSHVPEVSALEHCTQVQRPEPVKPSRSRSFDGFSKLRRSPSPKLPTVQEFQPACFQVEDKKVLENIRRSRSWGDVSESCHGHRRKPLSYHQLLLKSRSYNEFLRRRKRNPGEDRFLSMSPAPINPLYDATSKDLIQQHSIVRSAKEKRCRKEGFHKAINMLEERRHSYPNNMKVWPCPLEDRFGKNDEPAPRITMNDIESDQRRNVGSSKSFYQPSNGMNGFVLRKSKSLGSKSLSPPVTPPWTHVGGLDCKSKMSSFPSTYHDEKIQLSPSLASQNLMYRMPSSTLQPLRNPKKISTLPIDVKVPGQRPAFVGRQESHYCPSSSDTIFATESMLHDQGKKIAPPISPQRSVSPAQTRHKRQHDQ